MDSGFQTLDSSVFFKWNLDSGFQSLVGFRILWAVFRQPRPQGFSLKKLVGKRSLFLPHPFFKGKALGTRLVYQIPNPRIPDSTSNHFTDSGIRNPIHRKIGRFSYFLAKWYFRLKFLWVLRPHPHEYRFHRIRMEETLIYSGEWFQKDAVSMSRLTGIVRMEDQFAPKKKVVSWFVVDCGASAVRQTSGTEGR